jgi:hypothetical protein
MSAIQRGKTEENNGLRALIDELYAKFAYLYTQIQFLLFGAAFISVRFYGAVGNGSFDDTAAIQRAFNLTAPLGVAVWFPQGNWTVNAPVVEPDGLIVWADSAALFTADVAGAAASDSAFVTRQPVAIGAPTTLSGTPAAGSTTLPLTSTAGITTGTVLQVFRGAISLWAFYVVEAPPAGGNVTIDRAQLWGFQAGDAVQVVDQKPPCIHWYGNGCRMTGTCVLFFFGPAWNSTIQDVRFTGIVGGHADAVAGFHNGSLNALLTGCYADASGAISGFNAIFGLVGAEASAFTQNTALNGGPTCAALKLDDCRTSGAYENMTSGDLIGMSLGSDAGVSTNGNQWCEVRGNRIENCQTGLQVSNGTNQCTFSGNAYLYSTSAPGSGISILGGGGMQGLVFLGEQVTGGAGFGITSTAGAKGTQFFGCNVEGNANIDVQLADEFFWLGGYINSTGNVSLRMAAAATTIRGVVYGVRITNTTVAAASTGILNDGGDLSVSGALIELGHASDVGVWSNGTVTGALTYVEDTVIRPIGGVGGTIGLVAVSGQVMRIGPNVDADATATPIDIVAGGFCNRGSVTLDGSGHGAISFPVKTTENLSLTFTATVNPGFVKAVATPGTGYALTSTSGDDASTLAYCIL